MQGCSQSLTLHVRTLAWLSATLKPSNPSKKPRRSEEQPLTRRQKLAEEGRTHDVPDAGPAAYLLEYLWDFGPAEHNGMGLVPIGYSQINAWQQVTGLQLSPWESATLRQLSCSYCAELATATDPMAAAPGSAHETPEQAAERRGRVSGALSSMLRRRAKRGR